MNQQISEKTKLFANSAELYDIVEKIGAKFKLHIDQMGSLYAEISDILLGFSKSSEFINDTVKRLEIDHGVANQIAEEVNKEIFDVVKSKMQAQTIPDGSAIPTIESVGGFKIEKENDDETTKPDVTPDDREKILSGLENPPLHSGAVPPNLPVSSEDAGPFNDIVGPKATNSSTENHENHTEPIVDYLLSNPAGQGQKKVVVETKDTVPQPKTITKPSVVVPQRQGPDPYREAVK